MLGLGLIYGQQSDSKRERMDEAESQWSLGAIFKQQEARDTQLMGRGGGREEDYIDVFVALYLRPCF